MTGHKCFVKDATEAMCTELVTTKAVKSYLGLYLFCFRTHASLTMVILAHVIAVLQ